MNRLSKVLLFVIILMTAMILTSCSQVRSVSFDKDEYFVMPDEALTPEIKIRPRKAEYTITSSNPTIATVDDHQIIPKKEGIVFITVSA
ncbi:MAG: hypothetical protein ACOCWI_02270, partial [Bacillota bacterium]